MHHMADVDVLSWELNIPEPLILEKANDGHGNRMCYAGAFVSCWGGRGGRH